MKHFAIYELSKDGYRLFVEPNAPPLRRLDWMDYRPDVVGIEEAHGMLRIALVECETRPRVARIQEKLAKIASLTLQTRLNEAHRFRHILVIPPRTLHRILYPGLRRFWELWIVNRRGRYVAKIPVKGREAHALPQALPRDVHSAAARVPRGHGAKHPEHPVPPRPPHPDDERARSAVPRRLALSPVTCKGADADA